VLAEVAFLGFRMPSMLTNLRASTFLASRTHIFDAHLGINPRYVKMASLRVCIDTCDATWLTELLQNTMLAES